MSNGVWRRLDARLWNTRLKIVTAAQGFKFTIESSDSILAIFRHPFMARIV